MPPGSAPQQARLPYTAEFKTTRVQTLPDQGERDAVKLIEAGKQVIAEEPAARLDYFAVVDPNTLDPVADITRGALVAVAAYFGTTRLIDNIVLSSS